MATAAVSQRGERVTCDVLIVGGGIAGLSYALDLLDLSPDLQVALVCKQELGEGNSRYAQGGIAAVATDEDSVDDHIADTLAAGAGLCHEASVREVLALAPRCISRLVERGVAFDRRPDGSGFDLTLEGGHSHRRIYHTGDRTGAALVETLAALLRARDGVRFLEYHTAVDLITQAEAHAPGGCNEVLGAYVLDEASGRIHTVRARVTVLATGGAGKIFRYTSNPEAATGDGVAMCYRAGARVGNLEFFQFHPTLLYHPALNNFLITEALRGEGAHLRLPGGGDRFMARHDPERMELATRDVVVRAMFSEMEASAFDHLELDVRHLDAAFLASHFPQIHATLGGLGIDITTQPIPVVPAAHYLCGGVLADTAGRTDLDRLLVIGETAFTGLHGANRLASNSLIESVVMAHLAARATPELLESPVVERRSVRDWDSRSVGDRRRASQINAHWVGLRSEMTSYAGIVRTEAGLQDLLSIIAARREMIEGYYWTHSVTRDLIELRNIALVAELLARSALHRRESRGGHFREDHPQAVPDTRDTVLRDERRYADASRRFESPLA